MTPFLERQCFPLTSKLSIFERGDFLNILFDGWANIWPCDPTVYHGWIVERAPEGDGKFQTS